MQNEKGHLGHEMHFCGGKNIRDNFWESYQNCTHIHTEGKTECDAGGGGVIVRHSDGKAP